MSGHESAQEVLFQGIKYSFDDDERRNPPIEVSTSECQARLQFLGEVALGTKDAVRELEMTNSGTLSIKLDKHGDMIRINKDGDIGGELKTEYDSRLASLESGVKFEPSGGDIALSCGFTVHSKDGRGRTLMSQSVGVELPDWIKYRCEPQPIKGKTGTLEFEGNIGYSLKIRSNARPSGPVVTAPDAKTAVATGTAILLLSSAWELVQNAAVLVAIAL